MHRYVPSAGRDQTGIPLGKQFFSSTKQVSRSASGMYGWTNQNIIGFDLESVFRLAAVLCPQPKPLVSFLSVGRFHQME